MYAAELLPDTATVDSLSLPHGNGWNSSLIQSIFQPFEARQILQIPWNFRHASDQLI
jgi:hypothetical protein